MMRVGGWCDLIEFRTRNLHLQLAQRSSGGAIDIDWNHDK